MTDDELLIEYLLQAEEWQQQGHSFTVEELAPDCPPLWPALREARTNG